MPLKEAIRTRDFAAIAAKSDQLANPRNKKRFSPALLDAAKCNDVELLACLLANGCPGRNEVCETAAAHGHLACLQYAHEHGCPWDEKTCMWAAYHGRLTCLQYAHEHGCPWDERSAEDAAAQGHFDCLHYLLVEGAEFPSDEAKRQAAREVARGYLWPKLRCARRNVSGLLHVWRFTLVTSGQHGTAAASLARGLADLGADEAMVPLAHAVVPLATAAGVTAAVVRQAIRTGGVKRIAEGPIPLAKRRA
jgi:hypothetical protein